MQGDLGHGRFRWHREGRPRYSRSRSALDGIRGYSLAQRYGFSVRIFGRAQACKLKAPLTLSLPAPLVNWADIFDGGFVVFARNEVTRRSLSEISPNGEESSDFNLD